MTVRLIHRDEPQRRGDDPLLVSVNDVLVMERARGEMLADHSDTATKRMPNKPFSAIAPIRWRNSPRSSLVLWFNLPSPRAFARMLPGGSAYAFRKNNFQNREIPRMLREQTENRPCQLAADNCRDWSRSQPKSAIAAAPSYRGQHRPRRDVSLSPARLSAGFGGF
jgi:hypothetical protein